MMAIVILGWVLIGLMAAFPLCCLFTVSKAEDESLEERDTNGESRR